MLCCVEAGVKVRCGGIVLPDGQVMGEIDKNGCKCLGVDNNMQKEMKEKSSRSI